MASSIIQLMALASTRVAVSINNQSIILKVLQLTKDL